MTRSQLEGLLAAAFQTGGRTPSPKLFSRFCRLLALLRKVQPVVSNSDTVWVCPWVRTKGRLPGWHETVVHLYGGSAYVTLAHQYSFSVDLKRKVLEGILISRDRGEMEAGDGLLKWWFTELEREIRAFLRDPEKYNHFIERGLPFRYRLGKIQRKEIWDSGGKHFLVRDELRKGEIEEFEQALRECGGHEPFKKMTRDTFLGFCRIAYDAVFPKDSRCSLVKRYRLHADGRDDGLLELSPNDPTAILRWIKKNPCGGHPWEIIRGGNFTHISLFLHYEEKEKEWKLTLEGHSVSRAAETVKIAIALNRAKVKFDLPEKDYLAALVQGKDWIGMVPESILPMDCEDLFEPFGERIRSFVHLEELKKDKYLKSRIVWFPVRRFAPKPSPALPEHYCRLRKRSIAAWSP